MPRTAIPAPDRSWPLTGRDDDLTAVAHALEAHGTVVLGGAAGVGKSRLARELVARVATTHPVRIAAASASSRDIPLGAFAHWLGVDRGDGTETATLARAADVLRAAGPHSVLLVDDAHMLDGTSATLLHQLATDRALRIVATVRNGEPCPDAVTALWKDGAATRIEVTALDEDATGALLDAALGGAVDAHAVRRLYGVTLGNVLWLRHLVEGERAAGRLAASNGRWRWTGDPVLSPALEHLIDARIGTLEEHERRVLELVALGEPLGLGMLTTLAHADDVERVADRGLVVVTADGARSEVSLAHPLYGEAARSRLSLPRARRMRGEISRALRDTGARRAGDWLRRAVLDLDSDAVRDPALLALAAHEAIALSDFALGERLLRAVLDAGGGFEVQLSLAFLLGWQLKLEETAEALARAMELATATDERMRAFLARMQSLLFVLDHHAEGLALIEEEDARTPGRAEVAALRAVVRGVGGDIEGGARDALAVLGDDVSSQARSFASWAAAYMLAFRGGESTRLRAIVASGLEAARRAPETAVMLGNIAMAQVIDAAYAGTLDGAQERLTWADELMGAQGATWSGLFRGSVAADTGHPRTAVRLLESTRSALPGHGGGWSCWLHGRIAQGHALLGDLSSADAALETAERFRQPWVRIFDAEVEIARIWVAALRGARREATERARDLATGSRRRGARVTELAARHLAVRLGDRDQVDALTDLAAVLGTPRARASAAHATALGAEDVPGLVAASAALESCGMTLAAADAAAQAATTAREGGRAQDSTVAVERAGLLADRCEGATTPALQAARAPLRISDREREVAVLAAEGLTNREIAAHMHVSVRTVESHVYRACTRLGLPDRASFDAYVVARATP